MIEEKIGKIYTEEEAIGVQLDLLLDDDEETTFEVYTCPTCNGRFLVESEALEVIDEMWCPYCKTLFKGDE